MTRILIALLMMLTCLPAPAPAQPPGGHKGPPPAKVAVAAVQREMISNSVTLIGSVTAMQVSTVASQVAGRVLMLKARTGDVVRQGDPLALLDTTQNAIEQRRAQAQADAALVRLEQARSDLKLAQALLPQQAISTDEVAARERTVLEIAQELARHQGEVNRLAYLIEQATITAPFAGTVTKELTQSGEWVAVGGGVTKLVDLSVARVVVWVPENVVGGLQTGRSVHIDTEAGPRLGTLHAIIPDGDPKSRTFPVESRVDNADGTLFAGMLASVRFPLGEATSALTVPRDAIVTRGRSSHVWKVVDGAGIKIGVTTGNGNGDRVAVIPQGDLQPGDQVVTRGNERVRPGQPILVMP